MVKKLTITADYYNFAVQNSITPFGVGVILNLCYPKTGPGDPNYCKFIQRDTSTQMITNIFDITTNVGSDKTDGVDIALRYAYPTEFGRFGFIFDGTWLHKFDRTLGDGTLIRARGTYDIGSGIGGVYPAWKFNAGVSWVMGGLSAGVNTRFIGSYHECGDSSGLMNGATGQCFVDATYSRTVHPYSTYDVYLGYTMKSPLGRTQLAAGVLNVFD